MSEYVNFLDSSSFAHVCKNGVVLMIRNCIKIKRVNSVGDKVKQW